MVVHLIVIRITCYAGVSSLLDLVALAQSSLHAQFIRLQRKWIYLWNAIEKYEYIGMSAQFKLAIYQRMLSPHSYSMNKSSKKLPEIEISSIAKKYFPAEIFHCGSHMFSFINKPSATRRISQNPSPFADAVLTQLRKWARWPCPSKRPTRIMDCTTFLPVRASAFYPRHREFRAAFLPTYSVEVAFVWPTRNITKKYVSLCVSGFSLDVKVLK